MQYTITNGSTVIIDTNQKNILDNDIYAFIAGNENLIQIKRLRHGIDGIIFQSDNKNFSEEKILYGSHIEILIIGRVLWINNRL